MLDNYRDLIDELLGTPTALRTLLADRASEESATDEALGLIADLRDRDLTVLERLNRIRRQQGAYLRNLPTADELIAARTEPPGETDTLLTSFDAGRGEIVSLLMNLTLKDWAREAIHETAGEITLADEVESHVEFNEDQLARIREAMS